MANGIRANSTMSCEYPVNIGFDKDIKNMSGEDGNTPGNKVVFWSYTGWVDCEDLHLISCTLLVL